MPGFNNSCPVWCKWILVLVVTGVLCGSAIGDALGSAPFVNGVAPGPKIRVAIRSFAAAEAKQRGWLSQCALLGQFGKPAQAYECFLYTPGGSMNTMINGQPAQITIQADYRVAHSGCRYQIGFSQTNAVPPVVVENGCGASGLARIRAVLASR